MGDNRKRKREHEEEEIRLVTSTAPNPQTWSDLPSDLLVSIVDLLFSAIEYIAFSGVCRSWRSAAASVPCRGSPLLLSPAASYHDVFSGKWEDDPPRCSLLSPAAAANRTFRSPMSPNILRRFCIGCSHSQLIFVANNRLVLANPFTGREVWSPALPRGSHYFESATLTSSLQSDSCMVLLVSHNTNNNFVYILCWQPRNGDEWSEIGLGKLPELRSLLFEGKFFCLDSCRRLVVVELESVVSWRMLEDAQFSDEIFLFPPFSGQMVDCGGELLLLFFLHGEEFWKPGQHKIDIEVYRFDMAGSVWVRKENLGDWCLFVDVVGRHPFACSEPERWGGRRNCVYVAGPGYKRWSVFPLDVVDIDVENSPLNPKFRLLFGWPSPVWVYPTIHL